MTKRILNALCLMALMLTLGGCGRNDGRTLRVAEQFGIAYAPLTIMKQRGLLEAALPGMRVEWVQLGGPAAMREGMLSGDIDIGFMGIGPMLIGVDAGMDWRSFGALSANEVAFVTSRDYVRSLRDLKPSDRIAVLGPGSTQYILLCMAARAEMGDPAAFDARLATLSHPDAMSAMLAGGEVALHIATPPYSSLEVAAGMRKILTGEQLMGGPFSFICGVAMNDLYEQKRPVYDAFRACLGEAIGILNDDLPAAAQALAPVYGVDPDMLLRDMSEGGTIYGMALHGVDALAREMAALGLIGRAPGRDEYAFPEAEAAP